MASAMRAAGDLPAAARSATTRGDATGLPFPDDTFDRIIATEVLEHIADDMGAIGELVRVLRPGGTIAATVPAWLPEQICWALSDEYHAPFVAGGHVRIYTEAELRTKLGTAGAEPDARAPRPRPALAVLVAEVRGRPHQRRPPAGEGLPPGPVLGHRRHPAAGPASPGGRPGRSTRSSARASSSTPGKPEVAASDARRRPRHRLRRRPPRRRSTPSPSGSCRPA